MKITQRSVTKGFLYPAQKQQIERITNQTSGLKTTAKQFNFTGDLHLQKDEGLLQEVMRQEDLTLLKTYVPFLFTKPKVIITKIKNGFEILSIENKKILEIYRDPDNKILLIRVFGPRKEKVVLELGFARFRRNDKPTLRYKSRWHWKNEHKKIQITSYFKPNGEPDGPIVKQKEKTQQ